MGRVRVEDLFTISKGNAPSFDLYTDIAEAQAPTVAYVSASTSRNGVNGFVLPARGDKVFPADTITIAVQGQGSVAYASVQPHRYIASAMVLSLSPKAAAFAAHGLAPDSATLAALCACLRKHRWRFSFSRNADEGRVGELELDLDAVKEVIARIRL